MELNEIQRSGVGDTEEWSRRYRGVELIEIQRSGVKRYRVE